MGFTLAIPFVFVSVVHVQISKEPLLSMCCWCISYSMCTAYQQVHLYMSPLHEIKLAVYTVYVLVTHGKVARRKRLTNPRIKATKLPQVNMKIYCTSHQTDSAPHAL